MLERDRAAPERLEPSAYDRGRLGRQLASIAGLAGDLPAAETALREAIVEFDAAGLSGRLQLVTTLDQLAFVVGTAGRADDMRVLHARARQLELELAASRRAAARGRQEHGGFSLGGERARARAR